MCVCYVHVCVHVSYSIVYNMHIFRVHHLLCNVYHYHNSHGACEIYFTNIYMYNAYIYTYIYIYIHKHICIYITSSIYWIDREHIIYYIVCMNENVYSFNLGHHINCQVKPTVTWCLSVYIHYINGIIYGIYP